MHRLAALALLLTAGCGAQATRPAAPPAAPMADRIATPADRFGALFNAVQMRRLFPDGKTFVDAVPRRSDAAILADWRVAGAMDDAALRRFVQANFDLPDTPAAPPPSDERLPLTDHIDALWPVLTREPIDPPPGSSALALAEPFVVPGGRFREIYYWDSYFTMLGLVRSGRLDLARSMVADFGSLIDRFGHVPNGTRTYYLSRSQPPFLFAMIALVGQHDRAEARRHLAWLRAEHRFWMAGADGLRPGGAHRRVVRLADGTLLNRYWDDRDSPRDESWREDVLTAREAADRPATEVHRELRAGAESGWDFSSRWLADGLTLATIRTTAIAPVDLNALMVGMEREIAALCRALAEALCVADYQMRADARAAAIRRLMWVEADGRFADLVWATADPTPTLSAATLFPLFTRVATPDQAARVAATVRDRLTGPGGLRTTTARTGQQWDAPNGWAPLQWIAVAGLAAYGHDEQARDIARRFVATARREYRASGRLLEKYDVEQARPGGGGEYPLQDGFGWTNGVVRELIARDSTLAR